MKTSSVSGVKSAAKSSLKRPTGHLQYRQAEMKPRTPGKKSARLLKAVKQENMFNDEAGEKADWSQASFPAQVNMCLRLIQREIKAKKDQQVKALDKILAQ